ncbi:MAG: NAD-dependent epimerase/dehydratase family protein [Magnetococcales bacterium]|nr:NAD-dependent epimerase/dehydratase family protein [Magnetococcales bacterium]
MLSNKRKCIAILGATSQIAKDCILSFSQNKEYNLILYARNIETVKSWQERVGLDRMYPVFDYSKYGEDAHDVVINFIGVGDPARVVTMGATIFDVTYQYDQLVLQHLESNPERRYIFLSSGAVYGSTFDQPVSSETKAEICINQFLSHEYYSVAKLYAECRHRALSQYSIIDLRVFNYFSRTQDMQARFFITDMLRAIKEKRLFETSHYNIVRDYLHPTDFYRMIVSILRSPPKNTSYDCYTQAPSEKKLILDRMCESFGLQYIINSSQTLLNPTGLKTNYYSLNRKASETGYVPLYSSIETVLIESKSLLSN